MAVITQGKLWDPKAYEGKWIVNIKDDRKNERFEISVVREGNKHGQRSYGWFDENKLLITHNGNPMRADMPEFIWQKMIRLAHEVANELNESENKVCY